MSASTASFVGSGTCNITAAQVGNSTYAAANSVTQSFNVSGKASQTITFGPIPSQIVGGSLTVSATASSGLQVSFILVQNGNCSISGSVLTFLNVGNCGVIATQSGNSAYAAAPEVGQIIVVNNPTPQSITFNAIAAQTVGSVLPLSATASSGLAVSFASSTTGVCTVAGTTATMVGSGACTITASQTGNNVYSAAAPVSRSFTVNASTPGFSVVAFRQQLYTCT